MAGMTRLLASTLDSLYLTSHLTLREFRAPRPRMKRHRIERYLPTQEV